MMVNWHDDGRLAAAAVTGKLTTTASPKPWTRPNSKFKLFVEKGEVVVKATVQPVVDGVW